MPDGEQPPEVNSIFSNERYEAFGFWITNWPSARGLSRSGFEVVLVADTGFGDIIKESKMINPDIAFNLRFTIYSPFRVDPMCC